MKLKRIRPGVYEGRLEPYRVTITRTGNKWVATLWVCKGNYCRPGPLCPSLVAAKEQIARLWLRLRLGAMVEALDAPDELLPIWVRDCRRILRGKEGDPMSMYALRDWMHENGHADLWERYVLIPGRAARVKWPAGWDAVTA